MHGGIDFNFRALPDSVSGQMDASMDWKGRRSIWSAYVSGWTRAEEKKDWRFDYGVSCGLKVRF